ncbi:hypothetical protein ACFQBY_07350 [Promicromonospora citrea]|uniref:Uncharacterized protein n=1 Tax=Promicromonospora citrea TaxID=43677 RepID=A0A8H9L5S2_9MICO|nr:hypothetical protein [Promicromonospora citrea]NNH51336.1 hypothetical protein [Promicromonospora citrea]GGM33732.1 hypothetical protein GCM10010102_31630 [Promicromonospora citrea]
MSDKQWEELDGEPNTVANKGKKYTELAEAITRSVSTLQQIVDDTNTTAKAMDKTRKLAGEVREDIEKAKERYAYTGEALSTYGAALRTAKAEADPAAQRLRTLRNELETAQAAARTAESNVDDLPDDASDADKSGAHRAQTQANNTVAELQRQITAAESDWNNGHNDKNTAARSAISKIEEVVSGDKVNGLKDGFWDHVGAAWDSFYKFAKIICDVAGILAIFLSWVPVLGQILVALAAVGAILAIIDSAVKYIRGDIGLTGLLVGVGIGVLSLVGGKAAAHLAKVAKTRTIMTAVGQNGDNFLSTAARLSARGDDGFAAIRSAVRASDEGALGLKAALKSPFVRSDSQRAVFEAFKAGDKTFLGALAAGTKANFPIPFKNGMGGVLFRDANDLANLSRLGMSVEGPVKSAYALSAATTMGDVLKGFYGMSSGFEQGGLAGVSGVTGFVGSHTGGSWGSAAGAPNTIMGDLKNIGLVN